MTRLAPRRVPAAIGLGLVLLVAAVYGQVSGHAFINFDDSEYVYANPDVLQGLTPATIRWAFTTGHAANWHPLTWLSHALDVTLFGTWPGGHHLTNVVIDAANAVLLFLVLRAMTGALWRSAFAAALFAVHPLHVEVVAWVSERKELLGTLFGLLAIGAYHRYSLRPSAARMAAVAAFLALSLLSKPMWVTLPFVLLLLDLWPLARPESPARLLVEKLPLFCLSTLSCLVTWLAQSRSGAMASAFPLSERALNAPLAILAYLRQAVWPTGLAVFYPHPGSLHEHVSRPAAGLALVCVGLLAIGAVAARRFRPYAAVGALWFLGTLVPVIGLVQVGLQSRADRYTYVPLIGLFVLGAWSLGELAGALPRSKAWLAGTAGAILVALALLAHRQAAFWHDGEPLYRHAIAVTEKNWLAWNNLGTTVLDKGRPAEALASFEAAVRIIPDYAEAWYNAGVALGQMAQAQRALAAYRESLRLDSSNHDAWVNLGVLLGQNDPQEALRAFERAVRIRPDSAFAWYNAGVALARLGESNRAIAAHREAVRLDPSNAEAWLNLGLLHRTAGRAEDAAICFRRAWALRPSVAR